VAAAEAGRKHRSEEGFAMAMLDHAPPETNTRIPEGTRKSLTSRLPREGLLAVR
jgi:hypothetical protein